MRITRFVLPALLAFLIPMSGYAKRTHIATSTQKVHRPHIHQSKAGPYGFGGKLSKSKDHKYHPVKQPY